MPDDFNGHVQFNPRHLYTTYVDKGATGCQDRQNTDEALFTRNTPGCGAKSSRTKSVTVKDGEDDKRTFGPNPGAPGRNAKPCPPGQKRELVAQQAGNCAFNACNQGSCNYKPAAEVDGCVYYSYEIWSCDGDLGQQWIDAKPATTVGDPDASAGRLGRMPDLDTDTVQLVMTFDDDVAEYGDEYGKSMPAKNADTIKKIAQTCTGASTNGRRRLEASDMKVQRVAPGESHAEHPACCSQKTTKTTACPNCPVVDMIVAVEIKAPGGEGDKAALHSCLTEALQPGGELTSKFSNLKAWEINNVDSGLSVGAIVGIVCGSVAFVAIAIVAVIMVRKKQAARYEPMPKTFNNEEKTFGDATSSKFEL